LGDGAWTPDLDDPAAVSQPGANALHAAVESGVACGADSDGYPFPTWVGIFGDASTSSLLAGWDSYVFWTGRELQRSHYVWWNWAPGDTQYLGNF